MCATPSETASGPGGGAGTRAGYATLAGRPNAGKSTLLSALVGERLSIVTPKAQTTWRRMTGISTSERAQIVFLDTPGILEARDLLQRSMLAEAREALADADVVIAVLDATRAREEVREDAFVSLLREGGRPVIAAVNKVDAAPAEDRERLLEWAGRTLECRALPVSAVRMEGVAELRRAVEGALPPSPFLFPPDQVALEPVRFFVSELVRETVFELFRQEIPYSVAARVEEFREDRRPVYIRVTLFVERSSQKGILIGDGGRAIRRLGEEARRKIEAFLGGAVYLDLWVKVLPGWRRKGPHLRRLGFRLPRTDEIPA